MFIKTSVTIIISNLHLNIAAEVGSPVLGAQKPITITSKAYTGKLVMYESALVRAALQKQ